MVRGKPNLNIRRTQTWQNHSFSSTGCCIVFLLGGLAIIGLLAFQAITVATKAIKFRTLR